MKSEDQSLKKTEIIRRKADFDRVFKKGKSIVDPFFVALFVQNSQLFSYRQISASSARRF